MIDGVNWNSQVLELNMGAGPIHIPFMQASLLTCLLDRSDRYVSASFLGAYLYGGSPEGKTSERARATAVMHLLRGTLKGSGLSVHNKYGAGYRVMVGMGEQPQSGGE